MENILLQKALFYASQNLYVFPCREKHEGKYFSKKYKAMVDADPKQPRTGNGLKDATISQETITDWWTRKGWENSAIGINCGMSKLFVIDIDNHGKNGFENFMKLDISSEGAYHTKTANGGLHIIFYDPMGIGRNHSNEKLGIDTRGIGGYIVIPPSFIISKNDGERKEYKFINKEWHGYPVEISLETIKKLDEIFIVNKDSKRVIKQYTITKRDSLRAKKAVDSLPFDFLENYQDWLNVGMALRDLGDDGFAIWESWTDKYFEKYPESKRIGQLEYKWKTLFENNSNSRISLGSLFYWAKNLSK